MGTFNTKKFLNGSPSLIPAIANKMQSHFLEQGYEVKMEALSSGGYDVSISKGGMFKAVLGMKTALKIALLPQDDAILFDASVGIFGKVLIPTLIMWYVAWPVLLTQMWGLIKQANLDDEALAIAEEVIAKGKPSKSWFSRGKKYCPYCGTENPADALYCKKDGKPL